MPDSGRAGERGSLAIVWDYDSALGQLQSSYPYQYRRLPLEQELEAMADLRDLGRQYGLPMTFASVGFASEDIPEPFAAHDVLRDLYRDGSEVASHTWRHEWLPHLTTQQLQRSLLRSKFALERLVETHGAVTGLVPPFNRPMSWPGRGIIRPGDRWAIPFGAGATIPSLLRTAAGAGYRWVRISYHPMFERRPDPLRVPFSAGGVLAIPVHKNGFDAKARDLVARAADTGRFVNLYGHPAGMMRIGAENRAELVAMLDHASRLRDAGRLDIVTMQQAVDQLTATGTR